MNWTAAHREAMLAAGHAHRSLKIDTTRPIEIFQIIEAAEIVLAFRPFPKLSGAYFAEPGAPVGIVINFNHPLRRQRFTAAHEFGHHWFRHGTTLDPEWDRLESWGSGEVPDREKQAEAFASWFLMPNKLVRACMQRLSLDALRGPADVYRLSLLMGTSYEATARHMVNLKLAEAYVVNSWLHVSPMTVKQEIAGPWLPTDAHNDVWALDSQGSDDLLAVRPGDRILIRLEEIPSSGFTWLVRNVPNDLNLVGERYLELPSGSDSRASGLFEEHGEEAAGGRVKKEVAFEVSPTAESSKGTIELVEVQPWAETVASSIRKLPVEILPIRRGFNEAIFRNAA